MPYIRPINPNPVSPDEKQKLISEHVAYYEKIAQHATEHGNFSALNAKLPKVAAEAFLDEVGSLLIQAAAKAAKAGEVRDFLENNPLPASVKRHLPDDFRAFCLLLNSLKQWVSAESLATDRYLLGGTVRKKLKDAVSTCMVTGTTLEKVELHHAVRDGRPPIPLSPEGHVLVEECNLFAPQEPHMMALKALRAKKSWSWKMLRDGCHSQLGKEVKTRSKNSLASARSHANKAKELTGLSFELLLEHLDESGLGL